MTTPVNSLLRPLLLSEYRKLSTLRSTWWAVAAAPLVAALVAAVGVHLASATDRIVLTEGARGVAPPLWFLATVIAILAGAGEFQHHTVVTTLLTAPRRGTVLGAKAIVTAAFGALVTAAGIAAALLATVVTAQLESVTYARGTTQEWLGLAGAVLVGALFATLALALGVLTRSTALALTTLLLWRFVGEGILPVVTRRPRIADWTPSGAARAVIEPVHHAVSATGGGVLLLGYVALAAAAAAWTFQHRDPV